MDDGAMPPGRASSRPAITLAPSYHNIRDELATITKV
jgi:hypothetical protein